MGHDVRKPVLGGLLTVKSLISAFAIRILESIISELATRGISIS